MDSLARLRQLTDSLTGKPGWTECNPGTVLIVEDDPDCRNVLSTVLTRAGYEVYEARDFQEAEDIAQLRPEVALVDLLLPGKDGIEVGRMLKEQSPYTQCIMLTAFSTEEVAINALNLGFAGYLRKPYDAPDLLALLQNIPGR